MQKTIGGDRLGSGKKMTVDLHNYSRSTHDMGYLWRSTMAPGTLVPFLCEIALPGDTFDINLDCDVKTHPTIGPLFGSEKIQLDVFVAPIRLYNAMLHNNMLGIGLNMSQVKLPLIELTAKTISGITGAERAEIDWDNSQINPSCILSYLGLRGIGMTDTADVQREFNAVPLLAYWEIYKNYYANKQEEVGAVLHTPATANPNITDITITDINGGSETLNQVGTVQPPIRMDQNTAEIIVNYPAGIPDIEDLKKIMINTAEHGSISVYDLMIPQTIVVDTPNLQILAAFDSDKWGRTYARNWDYRAWWQIQPGKPEVYLFDLNEIDTMKTTILQHTFASPLIIDNTSPEPYKFLTEQPNGIPNIISSQEGLALKTYQSDLFNNWLQTEWIDGPGGINEITAIDTSGGSFTIDTLILSRKVYDMMNRIAVSGGSYGDWLEAVYTENKYRVFESPMYMGGLIKELAFQEVISNSESGDQALGTLAGRGVMTKKHKGGYINIHVEEPAYIIGLISITPRLDYSQGNKWDVHLKTMDDLHKPALDEIGFQESITEERAWWDTKFDPIDGWVQKSAGKVPSWINYMTNVNQTRGNFAVAKNEMFMTLNRRFETEIMDPMVGIIDLTTYIDPSKFNFIFAQTATDAQNFWAQIAVDITARRKMSARIMPNL